MSCLVGRKVRRGEVRKLDFPFSFFFKKKRQRRKEKKDE